MEKRREFGREIWNEKHANKKQKGSKINSQYVYTPIYLTSKKKSINTSMNLDDYSFIIFSG